MKKQYGPHTLKTYEIQLEHNGFDVEYLRNASREERIDSVVKSALMTQQWFKNYFVRKTAIEIGFAMLAVINRGDRQ
jgi:hypothetical protein